MIIWYYIRNYPISLILTGVVLYLSFLNAATLPLPVFRFMDKLAHLFMYGGLSGVLWIEFLWGHRKKTIPLQRGMVGAAIIPILFGGLIELGQAYLTTNRQGDWMDFLFNTMGVIIASFIAWYLIRPIIQKQTNKQHNS